MPEEHISHEHWGSPTKIRLTVTAGLNTEENNYDRSIQANAPYNNVDTKHWQKRAVTGPNAY